MCGIWADGIDKFANGDKIALEVNMDSEISTMHLFIKGKQQPICITNLPPEVSFSVLPLQTLLLFLIVCFFFLTYY